MSTAEKQSNAKLLHAQANVRDEFYTPLKNIEKELKHYDFTGKSIYCNCDDPDKSQFVEYFRTNFDTLGLEQLTSTCFHASGGMHYIKTADSETTYSLAWNGSFDSPECVELLEQADVVVTNPPFSLFKEYTSLLFEYDKQFVILSPLQATTYKDIYPRIATQEIWLGRTSRGGGMKFYVPPEYADSGYIYQTSKDGDLLGHVGSVVWLTNYGEPYYPKPIELTASYTPEKYPVYDNYPAIEVSRCCDIPCDYDGIMGVPISFIHKWNPDQFQIIGFWKNADGVYQPFPFTKHSDREPETEGERRPQDISAAQRPVIGGDVIYKRLCLRRVTS